MSTINGVGTFYYGADEPRDDGSRIATLWFVFFFFPILPLATRRIRKSEILGNSMQVEILEPLGLRWTQILTTYLRVWIGVPLILVWPLVVVIGGCVLAKRVLGGEALEQGSLGDKVVLGGLFASCGYLIIAAAVLLGRARRA